MIFVKPPHARTVLPQSCLLTRLFDEAIFIALEFFNTLGAGTFPLVYRIHLVPCVKELLLLAAEAVFAIAVRHVEGRAGYLTFGAHRRLETVPIYFGFTSTKRWLGTRKLRILLVAPDGIHSSDGGEQVVHVSLHVTVLHVHLLSALAALERLALAHALGMAFTPFLEGSPKVFGRDSVFPFDFGCTLLVLFRYESSRQINIFLLIERGSAVERDSMIKVDLTLQHLLRFGKTVVCFIACRTGGCSTQRSKEQRSCQKCDCEFLASFVHIHLLVMCIETMLWTELCHMVAFPIMLLNIFLPKGNV